jgi:hypothetical protein
VFLLQLVAAFTSPLKWAARPLAVSAQLPVRDHKPGALAFKPALLVDALLSSEHKRQTSTFTSNACYAQKSVNPRHWSCMAVFATRIQMQSKGRQNAGQFRACKSSAK